MDPEYYKKFEPVFGYWHIVKEIGRGSFGSVFEIARKSGEDEYHSALKIISVPRDDEELRLVRSEGMSEEDVTTYFRDVVDSYTREISLMYKLRGNTNIVSYEDHLIIEHPDSFGWDILIRMELLTPLNQYVEKKQLDVNNVIRLGMDVCSGLELCRRNQIIHRDIKPSNIFVSDYGDFKIGDFGVAKLMSDSSRASTVAGSRQYMAPEVYYGKRYDKRADIYSLGLMLYQFLNGNRMPFLPPAPERILSSQRDEAENKRLRGIPFPPPVNAGDDLAYVVLKACAYEPDDRYDTAEDMKADLICVSSGKPPYSLEKEKMPVDEPDEEEIPEETQEEPEEPEPGPAPDRDSKKTKKNLVLPVILCIALVLVMGIVFSYVSTGDKGQDTTLVNNAQLKTGSDLLLVGDITNVKYSLNGLDYGYLEGIEFSSSNDKVAEVFPSPGDNQVLVKGVGKGTAVIRGIKGNEYGEARIVVSEVDTASDVRVSCSIDQLVLFSDDPRGVTFKVFTQGKVPNGLTANAYNSVGLDLSIEGGFENNVLTLTVKDVASQDQEGVFTVTISDKEDMSHVLGAVTIPVFVMF